MWGGVRDVKSQTTLGRRQMFTEKHENSFCGVGSLLKIHYKEKLFYKSHQPPSKHIYVQQNGVSGPTVGLRAKGKQKKSYRNYRTLGFKSIGKDIESDR